MAWSVADLRIRWAMWLRRSAQVRLLWSILGPSLLGIALMAGLGVASANILSTLRAFVAAESLWAKGQKNATLHLAGYAASRDPDDLRKYDKSLAVCLGDQEARIELERPRPDLAVVRHGLLEGGNHPDDIESIIWMIRTFRDVSYLAEAIEIWAEADRQITSLNALAAQLQHDPMASDKHGDQVEASWAQIVMLNDRFTSIEQRFSAKIGEASRMVTRVMTVVTLSLGFVLAAAATLLTTRVLRRNAAVDSALRESEDRLQRALEASDLALWDLDVETGHVYLSESWSKRLGGPWEESNTTLAALFDLVPEIEQPGVMAKMIAALKDPSGGYHVEHRVRMFDGGFRWNLSRGRVVGRAPDGRALRMVGTNRDITERVQAEAARSELESQLRESQKMEAIGVLAGGIAHDFNNILAAIIGNVVLAHDDVKGHSTAQASLHQIRKSAVRARGLVQQILAFSRSQPQQLMVQALHPLVHEALALMRASLPAGVALDVDLADVSLHVLADATQLHQVVMNLCTNAWHSLTGASGRIRVGLDPVALVDDASHRPAGLPPGRYAHLSVRDDGCGMDAATLTRIFEPFFTTKQVGQGTGLGLSVVRGIVASHAGAMTVQSVPGEGSTFHVYLPLVEAPVVEPEPSDWSQLERPPTDQRGEHVLYIDDDDVMLIVVEQLLQRHGYRVTCHQDSLAALAAVRLHPFAFDLVVSDFNMPQCSGIDVAIEVAKLRSDLPVVISSGYISEKLRVEALQAGVRELMRKENTVEELAALVERVLQVEQQGRARVDWAACSMTPTTRGLQVPPIGA